MRVCKTIQAFIKDILANHANFAEVAVLKESNQKRSNRMNMASDECFRHCFQNVDVNRDPAEALETVPDHI